MTDWLKDMQYLFSYVKQLQSGHGRSVGRQNAGRSKRLLEIEITCEYFHVMGHGVTRPEVIHNK